MVAEECAKWMYDSRGRTQPVKRRFVRKAVFYSITRPRRSPLQGTRPTLALLKPDSLLELTNPRKSVPVDYSRQLSDRCQDASITSRLSWRSARGCLFLPGR